MENSEEKTTKTEQANSHSIPDTKISFLDIFPKFQVELAYNEEKGRHMVASRNLARGSIVYMGDPYTFVVNPKVIALFFSLITQWWRVICHHCLQPSQNLSSCAACHQTFYCSKECQVLERSFLILDDRNLLGESTKKNAKYLSVYLILLIKEIDPFLQANN